jgi:hypothetical protein
MHEGFRNYLHAENPEQEATMIEVRRLGPREARERCQSGAKLVCAYESEEAFGKNRLAGAISLKALQNLVPQAAKEDELIFYCA